MQEIFDTIEKHWAVFSAAAAGILYLVKHMVNAHQVVAVAVTELASLKLRHDAKVTADDGVVKDLNNKIDDYHLKAVAREDTLRKEAQHLVDKAQIDIRKELTLLERELRTDISRVADKQDKSHELLVQILNDNKHMNETVTALLKAKEEQGKRTEEFWKEYGALLPALKTLLKPRMDG
jgi:hypothetical protein